MKHHPFPIRLSIAFISLGLATSLSAQKVWNTDDGQWSTPSNWIGGVPSATTGAHQAQFLINSSSTEENITVTIEAGLAAKASYIEVGLGKNVTLQLENGALLTTAALWGVGANIGTGTGAGHLTIKGPETGSATITSGYFFVGRSDASGGGNSLTFSGNTLTVNDTGTSTSSIGRFGNNNTLYVQDGAALNRYSLALSPNNADAGRIGNGAIVRGAGSTLALGGGILQIGNTASARGNYVRVENSGTLEIKAQKSTLIGAASSHGGNSLEVSTGGTIKTDGAITIHAHADNAGDNDGANRLSILSGGTLISASTITSAGLLQLESGGTLRGAALDETPATLNITIENNGRFEVDGDGLEETVDTTIQSGGTLAIGVRDANGEREGAATLTLASSVHLADNSILELTIFGSAPSEIDKIILAAEGVLLLDSTVTLKLILDSDFTPQAGESWTPFTGLTTQISGNFDLSALDPTQWDTSHFNEEGQWALRAIPEPRAVAAYALGSALIGLHLRLRRRNTPRHT